MFRREFRFKMLQTVLILTNNSYPGTEQLTSGSGCNLSHNFGHGKNHLANVFFSLNILAFLAHTSQHLLDTAYRILREALAVRRTFFNDLKALTRYMVFDSWQSLFELGVATLHFKKD